MKRTLHASAASLIALGLALALLGCQGPGPAASRAPEARGPRPSASASASAAAVASGSVAATSTTSANTTGSTAASRTVAATAAPEQPSKARVAPLLAPIAILPQPKPARTLRGPSTRGVPVLMYHVIGTAPPGAHNPDLYVTPDEFVAQMSYLSKHGYHAVTLQQVWDYWHGTGTLPSKPIVLSFDDGDTPDFTIVAPLLAQIRWPGTLNLIVGRKHPRMRPPVVRALIAAGWEIDSHTISHADVPGLPPAKLRREVAGSRAALRRMYGVPVNFFCYPSGRYDAAAIEAVKAAGYLGATTTRGGLARPETPYLMRRVRVSAGYSPSALAALLADAK